MADRIRSVAWSAAARSALDDALAYIAEDSPAAVARLLVQALQVAENLSTLSARGRIVPEIGDRAVREVFVRRYRLPYRIEEDRVIVLAFLHGARDFTTWRQSQAYQ